MKKNTLYVVAIICHPTQKELNDGKSSYLLVEPINVLANSMDELKMQATLKIPSTFEGDLDQLEIVFNAFTRPF